MSTGLSRRRFLQMAGTVSGIAVLQACAPAATPADQTGAAPVSAEPIKLTFWTHDHEPLMNFVEKKMEEYKEIHPNVEFEYAVTKPQDHDERLFTTLAAGSGPDGFNNGDWNYGLLLSNGWLAPVQPEGFGVSTDQEVQNLFIESSLTGLVDNDKLYALPFEWNALSLYYNRGLFNEAGLDPDKPPQTWEEVTDYAVKLTKYDDVGNIIQPGFLQHYGPAPEWPIKRLHPMLVQAGQNYLNETLDACALNDQQAIDIIEYYTDWTTKDKVSVQGFEIPGVGTSDTFSAGYAGMYLSGNYFPGAIKTVNPEWEFKGDDGWDIANFPEWAPPELQRKASAMWRWGLFVNSASPQIEEMWSFLYYMVSDWKAVRDEIGYLPSVKGWTDDPENTKNSPWLTIQLEDLDIGVPMPQTPEYQAVARQLMDMLERIYDGTQTPADSVAECCQKIDGIFESA